MSRLVITALAAVAMLSLAGCGIQLERSTGLRVTGGAFNQALYDNYIARSRHEYNEGHYLASDDFAVRAREAASGASVTPYRLQGREFPGDTVDDLRRARAELIEALAKSARTKAPEQAGRAQVMFDCWVEEQEENRQPEDIAYCRGNLRDALDQIRQALAPQPQPEAEAEPMADIEQVAAIGPRPRFVHFAFDSAALDDQARTTIDKVVEAAERAEAPHISVTGHADRAGPEDYNMKLSIRRADAVRDALVERGIPAERISVAGRGESEPLIPTGDGVRNRVNRRAEIILQ
jgi:OOP family OmpA-OmpF porin